MKITVFDTQTGTASQHWPVDADEIVANGGGRYTTDPKQVKGDIRKPQLAEAPSREEEAQMQLADAEAELEEASADLADHAEAEADALRELGELEAESGEPTTPQLMPSHFLDEEAADYPSEWKYRRHAVSQYGQTQSTAKIKHKPHVSTVYESPAEQRRAAAMRKAADAKAALQEAGAGRDEAKTQRRGAANQALTERKQQLDEKKQAAQKARDDRKAQRQKEREERKAARDATKQAEESESETE